MIYHINKVMLYSIKTLLGNELAEMQEQLHPWSSSSSSSDCFGMVMNFGLKLSTCGLLIFHSILVNGKLSILNVECLC